ncbi:unnamed protein product [Candidula unifasciata]|uniref:B-like cyclin n=1 Tax=Candidula unifasciata TaxID=100452 RepID=A0A8S3Z260_9EUPU|nr:unnamed protein product [Candidula unifasciata]
MAGVFRSQNSNAGTSDEVSKENIHPKVTRANAKRHALGNVTNQLRIQPQRLVKGKQHGLAQQGFRIAEGQENQAPAVAKGFGSAFGGFAIFEDVAAPALAQRQASCEDEPMMDTENLFPDAPESFSHVAQYLVHPLELNKPSASVTASPMFVDDSFSRSLDSSPMKNDEFGLEPYFQDIYSYMRRVECAYWPDKSYMSRQCDVTTSMRNILVDWLVEVGEEYKLQRETLFLAVNYIDRFLSVVGVFRPKLQLVGAASMFIAAKYEEIYPPDVAEFVYITDDSYNKQQILKMETVILRMLGFKVAVPTINWFCERFIEMIDMPDKARCLAFFLIELSLIEIEEFLAYRQSIIAASAIVIARSVLDVQNPWPHHMEQVSGYSLAELKPCIELLFSQYRRKDVMPQQAVIEKYKQSKFAKVSLLPAPRALAIL